MDTPSSGRPRPICLKPPAIAEESVTFAVGSPARSEKTSPECWATHSQECTLWLCQK